MTDNQILAICFLVVGYLLCGAITMWWFGFRGLFEESDLLNFFLWPIRWAVAIKEGYW